MAKTTQPETTQPETHSTPNPAPEVKPETTKPEVKKVRILSISTGRIDEVEEHFAKALLQHPSKYKLVENSIEKLNNAQ